MLCDGEGWARATGSKEDDAEKWSSECEREKHEAEKCCFTQTWTTSNVEDEKHEQLQTRSTTLPNHLRLNRQHS